MKRILSLLTFAALWCNAASAMSASDTTGIKKNLQAHLQYLASEELHGRKAGSEDARKAADYICAEWEKIGLTPIRQEFTRGNGTYVNLLAHMDGNDPALKDEIVIIGAHYDHLGVRDGQIYPGADDNASGTAAVIEVARQLMEMKGKLARTVYIAAFDGEELGLFGSDQLAKELADKDVVLISADMVGWYKATGSLTLEGSGTIRHGDALLKEIAARNGINVELKKFEDSIFTATDTRGFAQQKRATLAATTGLKSPYHQPEDTPDKIDYDGLAAVSCYLADLVGHVASEPDYKPSGKVASIHRDPKASIGVTVGIGSGFLDFGSKSAVAGRTKMSERIGVDGRINLGRKFAIKAGCGLEQSSFWMPQQEKVFSERQNFDILSVDAPVEIIWNMFGSTLGESMFLSAGGYYNYIFAAKLGEEHGTPEDTFLNRNGYGLQFGFGFNMGTITIGLQYRRPLTDLFQNAAAYGLPTGARHPRNYFIIGKRF